MVSQRDLPTWLAGDPLFHEIWAQSLDAMALSDEEGVVLLANAAYFELYGYTSEQVIGQDFTIIFPEAERPGASAAYRSIFAAGQPLPRIEAVIRRADGGTRIVESRASFVERDGRRYMLSIVRDITERKQAEDQLREAKQLLEVSQHVFHLGSFEVALATGAVHWSRELFHIFGLPPDASPFTSAELLERILVDDRERVSAHIAQLIASGVTRPIEYRIVRLDGEIRSLLDISRLEGDRQGRPERVIGAMLDITDLRRVEDERARLAEALEASPDLVGISDPAGRVLYLNAAGRELFGLASDAELAGLHVRDLFDPSVYPRMEAEVFPQALAEGIWRGESLIHAGGRSIPIAQVIIRHTDAAGKVSHFSTMARDISAYRSAEEALAELNRSLESRVVERTAQLAETIQELLEEVSTRQAVQAELQSVLRLQRAILDSAGYAIIATRLDGIIRSFNPAAERMLGYRADEVIGLVSLLSFHDQDELRDRHEDIGRILGVGLDLDRGLLRPVVIGEQPYEAEWTYRRADGTTLPVSVSLTTLRDDLGQPEGFLAVLNDVSQRRAAEETLRRANHDLARVARLKDEFLANMSHELRTPLNSILGRSEMLIEQVFGPLNERQLRSLHNIEESGRDLLALINDILDIAKIESGRMDLQLDVCEVPAVCNASLRLVAETAHKKQIALSTHFDGDVTTIVADQRRLKQILVNLLSNAVKFTPAGGRVGFETRGDPAAGEMSFTVWDTGIGIAPEDQGRLFQPFVQIDSSLSRQYAGTGLGLSLVDRLVRMHGGRVEMVSSPGEGSRFTVFIPWRSTQSNMASLPELAPFALPEERMFSQAVILVVDDNTDNRDLLREYLEARDYVVAIAQSGSEALTLAPIISPDLIVMDIQMPGLDGIEAIRRLRASPAMTRLPIIALTALAMVGDRERCLEAGASAYVSRPVALRELVTLIERHLAQARGAS